MISVTARKPEKISSDMLVYFMFERKGKSPLGGSQERQLVKAAWKAGDFKAKRSQTLLFYTAQLSGRQSGEIAAPRILVVGLGKAAESREESREQLRLAGGTAAAVASRCSCARVVVAVPDVKSLKWGEAAESLSEGLIRGNYRFDKYKSKKKDDKKSKPVKSFILHGSGSLSSLRRGMRRGHNAALAACTELLA